MSEHTQIDGEFQIALFNASQCLIEEAVQRTKDDILRDVLSRRLPAGGAKQSSFSGVKIAGVIGISLALAGYSGVKYLECGGFALPGETAPPTAVNIATDYTPPETIISDHDKAAAMLPAAAPKSECDPKLKPASLEWCKKHGPWKPKKH